jgi:hypothetical protein
MRKKASGWKYVICEKTFISLDNVGSFASGCRERGGEERMS